MMSSEKNNTDVKNVQYLFNIFNPEGELRQHNDQEHVGQPADIP
jgi:hypothetical protein